MSQYALRLPNSLFEQAKKTAKADNISMNQLFVTAIAEQLAVLEAESLIKQRAERADLDAFRRILDKVPKGEIIPGDEILE